MGSEFHLRDGKSKSKFFPEPEKGPGWKSWVNPSQGSLGGAGSRVRGLLKQGMSRLL